MTEELEDDAETTGAGKGAYADYKFVDKEELDTYVPLRTFLTIANMGIP